MPNDEAIDLIETLPPGSAYAAATNPLRAWSEERQLAADVEDDLLLIAWRLGTWEGLEEPPHVTRPKDVLARARARAKAKRAREVLESDGWEEM